MKLTDNQKLCLFKLSKKYNINESNHPRDAYHGGTLDSLQSKGLIETYYYNKFLHGAVRLTDQGKKQAAKLNYVLCKKDFFLGETKVLMMDKLYPVIEIYEKGFLVKHDRGLQGFTNKSEFVEIIK